MNRFALMPFDALIREAEELEQQLAEANKKLEELQGDNAECLCTVCNVIHPIQLKGRILQPCPECGTPMHPTSFNLRRIKELEAIIAKAKEEGRAEAQARIKVLEDALRQAHHAIKGREHTGFIHVALSTTSPTEALDKVVLEAKEDIRERIAAEFEGQYTDSSPQRKIAEAIRRIDP